ncbi:TIGR04255 family protein [Sulfuriflexus mobilis]|uniref:TIGR04255 family protein n=1 Tax=Sulfuriflexus mobilis TaxID=1811807 RepID=UPI000F826702|nr:TIGR04255 family protein [Sulfuriflexus mobilis]
MIDRRHLINAPIKEALIDIQVVLPDDIDLSQFQSYTLNGYPTSDPINQGKFGFHLEQGRPARTSIDESFLGIRFTTADETQVVQFKKNGFTFSRLEPYENWETMRDEAHRLWDIYKDMFNPTRIIRAATRYINLLNIPGAHYENIQQFLIAPPVIPKGLPTSIDSYLSRVVISEESFGGKCIVTHALEQFDEDNNISPIVLDIDTFIDCQIDIGDESNCWGALEQLHDFKNLIFFESITEEMAELCK